MTIHYRHFVPGAGLLAFAFGIGLAGFRFQRKDDYKQVEKKGVQLAKHGKWTQDERSGPNGPLSDIQIERYKRAQEVGMRDLQLRHQKAEIEWLKRSKELEMRGLNLRNQKLEAKVESQKDQKEAAEREAKGSANQRAEAKRDYKPKGVLIRNKQPGSVNPQPKRSPSMPNEEIVRAAKYFVYMHPSVSARASFPVSIKKDYVVTQQTLNKWMVRSYVDTPTGRDWWIVIIALSDSKATWHQVFLSIN